MSFCLMFPAGDIHLLTLMADAKTRLLYLCQLHQRWGDEEEVEAIYEDHPDIANNSGCLVERSTKDTTTFYMLKLAAMTGDESFKRFLNEAETYFLEHRLVYGGMMSIKTCIAEALSHARQAQQAFLTNSQTHFYPHLIEILEHLVESEMNDCIIRKTCHHTIKVWWRLVLALVQSRSVELEGGQAVVECHQVVPLLCCLFSTCYNLAFKHLEQSLVLEKATQDPRVSEVIQMLQTLYRRLCIGETTRPARALRHHEVEGESKYFPPCMRDLHGALKAQHRLRHGERYRYSLYLKDIGVPLKENIAFWENFYLKPHSGAAGGCTHAWQGSGKRYIYSLRHMYGQEGHRVNRPSHSCSSLQTIQPSAQDRGGCPFASHAPEHVALLEPLLGPNAAVGRAIRREVRAGRPSAACKTFMALALKGGCPPSDSVIRSVIDIEDVADLVPSCVFKKPSQHYMKVVAHHSNQ
ncbi:putative DNA primase large subunit [Chionoecetes opilio]|uniref:Putative DNA primase large subunit n=1 Tax=Chionoecetes opilio TaxID=41210 RepID=A0A8J4Y9S6_CHIOP|nr:putative DNA primase large subunit [Chionoecetes opilio]